MNRFLVIAALGLMAVGCATGVDDPQPEPAQAPASHGQPAQVFDAPDIDTSKPDPAQITNGLAAPNRVQEFERPMPMGDGAEKIDPNLESDDHDVLDPKWRLDAPVDQ